MTIVWEERTRHSIISSGGKACTNFFIYLSNFSFNMECVTNSCVFLVQGPHESSLHHSNFNICAAGASTLSNIFEGLRGDRNCSEQEQGNHVQSSQEPCPYRNCNLADMSHNAIYAGLAFQVDQDSQFLGIFQLSTKCP